MTESPRPDLRFLLSSPATFLALGGGAGLSPWAPGTAGSIVGVLLTLMLQTLPFAWQLAVWVALCVAGLRLCDRAGRALGVPDHPAIVWDEICGVSIVLLLGPSGLAWAFAGFLAFRFFDILKPWPIYVIDRRFANGAGVMADDLMAAAYATVAVTGAHAAVALLVA